MQGLPPVGGEGFQNPDPAQRHHHCPGGGQEGRPGGSGGAIRGGPPRTSRGDIDGGGDGGLLLKNLDLDLFREKLLDKLGADWGRPTPELLQAQTTAEEAKAKHQARQAKGALETRMLEPIKPPFSAWPNEVRVAIETGVFEPTTAWRDSMDDLTSLTDSYLEAKAVISLGRNPFPAALLADLPDLAGIPIPKRSGVVRPGAEGPDRQPTIPPASGSGATSSGAEGPDKPSATPVGLDTQDPEVQLAVLRWMRVGEVRIFAGRWVRRPGPVHVPDWANNLTKVNPEALEKGTHPRNHQVGGLPWARYSVDELYQQAKAGDRFYSEDLRSIFWEHQISSWTLPGLLGMFGHSFTVRQLWEVWESLPLLQGLGPEEQGPESDPPEGLGDPEGRRALPEGGGPSVSADRTGVAIGLPGHGQGPHGPGLPHGHPGGGDAAPGPGRGGLQGADDPPGGMR